ncbi:MAG: hypothetical protein HY744_16450 [Deltaproteobacteria bacterium]|nr:hypothetical protein [Deltaproteobacteria bacterium]
MWPARSSLGGLRASLRRREPLLWQLWAAGLVVAVATLFYAPALARTGGSVGRWPVPLDDVYIYFGFARSAALGHPFEHFPGNGYSSGATSVLYPLLLAPAWAAGWRRGALGAFAALLAAACLFDLCRTLRALGRGIPGGRQGEPTAAAGRASWLLPPLLLCVPLLDWSLLSGMETALLAAVAGRAMLACRRAACAAPAERAGRQRRAGLWLCLLVLARPEMLALAIPLGVAVAYWAGSLCAWRSLGRALGPPAAVLGAQAAANRWLTGEPAPAGAVRKALWSVPYLDETERALAFLTNLAVLVHQGIERALGGRPWAYALAALALAGLASRRHHTLAAPLLLGAAGALLLACCNTTAPYQNLRYAAPSLLFLLMAAGLGLRALCARRATAPVGLALGLLAVAAPAGQWRRQIDHFARASRNILDQHGEVAQRLRAQEPRPRRVLVGDAGAIPYLSGIGPIDGLGLGGYRGLPFARASVHGVPAVVELIERLPPGERPDAMALYPLWWRGLADAFGRPRESVRIADNVICTADEKVIYDADWSALAAPDERRAGEVDRLDVADLVDEQAHDYDFPGPHGGWVVGTSALLAPWGAPGRPQRFDAGRIVPEGRSESFAVRGPLGRAPARLVLRTDGGAPLGLVVEVQRSRRRVEVHELAVPQRRDDVWTELHVWLRDVAEGDRLRVRAVRGPWRSFHYWLLRP